jgi:hypothetical protein
MIAVAGHDRHAHHDRRQLEQTGALSTFAIRPPNVVPVA